MTYGYRTNPLQHSQLADSDFAPPTRGELFMHSRPDLYPYVPGGTARQARLLQVADALQSTPAADWAAYNNDRQRLASEALIEAMRMGRSLDAAPMPPALPESLAERWASQSSASPSYPKGAAVGGSAQQVPSQDTAALRLPRFRLHRWAQPFASEIGTDARDADGSVAGFSVAETATYDRPIDPPPITLSDWDRFKIAAYHFPQLFGFAPLPRNLREAIEYGGQNAGAAASLLPLGGAEMPPAAAAQAGGAPAATAAASYRKWLDNLLLSASGSLPDHEGSETADGKAGSGLLLPEKRLLLLDKIIPPWLRRHAFEANRPVLEHLDRDDPLLREVAPGGDVSAEQLHRMQRGISHNRFAAELDDELQAHHDLQNRFGWFFRKHGISDAARHLIVENMPHQQHVGPDGVHPWWDYEWQPLISQWKDSKNPPIFDRLRELLYQYDRLREELWKSG